MAHVAIETDGVSTDTTGQMCQHCGDKIPGRPFYSFRDIVRNAAGEFVPTPNASVFCDVRCQRQYETSEASDA